MLIFLLHKDVSSKYSAVLETILSGHEGWVYSVCWHPRVRQGKSDSLAGYGQDSMSFVKGIVAEKGLQKC